MEVEITQIKKDTNIGGFSIETILKENREKYEKIYKDLLHDKDTAHNKELIQFLKNIREACKADKGKLYKNIIHNGQMEYLNNITKNKDEYYTISWTDVFPTNYKYLIGQIITAKADNLEKFVIRKGKYAFCKFSKGYDIDDAWQKFFCGISKIGYKPIEDIGAGFNYYSNGLDGKYELWHWVR